MVPCSRPVGWLFVALLLVMAACSGGGPDPSSQATSAQPDAQLIGDVSAAFATYRSGVTQGDADAVVASVDQRSLQDMALVAELARTADESTVRALPAADQLLVLTYRLQPDLLQAEDPYRELVSAGLAGQDRSLGELGQVTVAGEDLALGVVVDSTNGAATPLRWRFTREEGSWRFDLADAHRLLSQAVATGANRAQVSVDQLVTATIVDLSGQDEATISQLYQTLPA